MTAEFLDLKLPCFILYNWNLFYLGLLNYHFLDVIFYLMIKKVMLMWVSIESTLFSKPRILFNFYLETRRFDESCFALILEWKRFLYIYWLSKPWKVWPLLTYLTLSHPSSLVISRFQPHGLLLFLWVSKTPSCVFFLWGRVYAGTLFLSASSWSIPSNPFSDGLMLPLPGSPLWHLPSPQSWIIFSCYISSLR